MQPVHLILTRHCTDASIRCVRNVLKFAVLCPSNVNTECSFITDWYTNRMIRMSFFEMNLRISISISSLCFVLVLVHITVWKYEFCVDAFLWANSFINRIVYCFCFHFVSRYVSLLFVLNGNSIESRNLTTNETFK